MVTASFFFIYLFILVKGKTLIAVLLYNVLLSPLVYIILTGKFVTSL